MCIISRSLSHGVAVAVCLDLADVLTPHLGTIQYVKGHSPLRVSLHCIGSVVLFMRQLPHARLPDTPCIRYRGCICRIFFRSLDKGGGLHNNQQVFM